MPKRNPSNMASLLPARPPKPRPGGGRPAIEASEHGRVTTRAGHILTSDADHRRNGTPDRATDGPCLISESECGTQSQMVDELVAEAERGYEPGQLAARRRGRGRPPLGDSAKSVESVRLEPALQAAAAQRAVDGVTVSEVVRRALREYLHTE